MTVLGGTLFRDESGTWHWADGTPEPRVWDLTLCDLAPNWRCITFGSGTYVEIRCREHRKLFPTSARRRAEAPVLRACAPPASRFLRDCRPAAEGGFRSYVPSAGV